MDGLLRRWIRTPLGTYDLADEERAALEAVVQAQGLDLAAAADGPASARSAYRAVSAPMAAAAVPATLRWSSSSHLLAQLLEMQQEESTRAQLRHCSMVERAMRSAAAAAAAQAEEAGPAGRGRVASPHVAAAGPRFPFTVHT